MSENNVSEQKIRDLTKIFMNTYEYTLQYGGVRLSVSEILLAVNSFHAAVVLDIGNKGDSENQLDTKDLYDSSVKAFKQALEQEAI